MRKKFLKLLIKYLKRNEYESSYLREIYRKHYNINIGLYSYGCFDEHRIPRNTSIGRYCSFAPTSFIFGRNHGIEYLLTHPYLYNSSLGLIESDTISYSSIKIEDDVWIGHNAIILPSVNYIGRGAVIGAGSVVTKNVEPYSIICGNPAKVIRYRFTKEEITHLESTQYWKLSKSELKKLINSNPKLVYSFGMNYE